MAYFVFCSLRACVFVCVCKVGGYPPSRFSSGVGTATRDYGVPSLKNTASIFPEILLIQYFAILVAQPMT